MGNCIPAVFQNCVFDDETMAEFRETYVDEYPVVNTSLCVCGQVTSADNLR